VSALLGASGAGTPDDPWRFSGPSGRIEAMAFRDRSTEPPMLVVQVGAHRYRYAIDRLEDLVSIAHAPPVRPRSGANDRESGDEGLRRRLTAYARQLLAVPRPGGLSRVRGR
jgi:hypothetical protein